MNKRLCLLLLPWTAYILFLTIYEFVLSSKLGGYYGGQGWTRSHSHLYTLHGLVHRGLINSIWLGNCCSSGFWHARGGSRGMYTSQPVANNGVQGPLKFWGRSEHKASWMTARQNILPLQLPPSTLHLGTKLQSLGLSLLATLPPRSLGLTWVVLPSDSTSNVFYCAFLLYKH